MPVFWAVEPPGSTAQSNLADQNIRRAIRDEQHKLDFILRVNRSFPIREYGFLYLNENDLLGRTAHGTQEFVMGLQVLHL